MKKSSVFTGVVATTLGIAVVGASFSTNAAPDPVLDVAAVQSQGSLLYDTNGDGIYEIGFYADDLTNLKSEIVEMGDYVASGKCSVGSALYTNGATDTFTEQGYVASTGEVPTFEQLRDGVHVVYQKGAFPSNDDLIAVSMATGVRNNPYFDYTSSGHGARYSCTFRLKDSTRYRIHHIGSISGYLVTSASFSTSAVSFSCVGGYGDNWEDCSAGFTAYLIDLGE